MSSPAMSSPAIYAPLQTQQHTGSWNTQPVDHNSDAITDKATNNVATEQLETLAPRCYITWLLNRIYYMYIY